VLLLLKRLRASVSIRWPWQRGGPRGVLGSVVVRSRPLSQRETRHTLRAKTAREGAVMHDSRKTPPGSRDSRAALRATPPGPRARRLLRRALRAIRDASIHAQREARRYQRDTVSPERDRYSVTRGLMSARNDSRRARREIPSGLSLEPASRREVGEPLRESWHSKTCGRVDTAWDHGCMAWRQTSRACDTIASG